MKISLHWLKEYVKINASVEELAERLTMAGFEVESIERQGERFDRFVVGKVENVSRHPFADRLSVCQVNIGQETRQIVCGAQNVASGQSVVVGLPGAQVPHDQHDPDGKPFTLSQVKIRNVESFGMICSAYELGLGEDKNGILVLDGHPQPGTGLSTLLGLKDTIFDINVTPNRPDGLSHIGIAREISALFNKKLNLPDVKISKPNLSSKDKLIVKVLDPLQCPRYSAKVVRNVKVGISPKWLSDRLTAVGIRPVNNIVDITNYVLMELGHPLHAFDYDKISAGTIIVRRANDGEKFNTLDHKERTLAQDTLMITDSTKPLAIAGVMGGENSEISESTVNIVLESAYFNPRSIRKTSKRFGLTTDASQRFERGADPNVTVFALDRAISLIISICGGEGSGRLVDVYPKKIRPKTISLRLEKLNEILGTSIDVAICKDILHKLSLKPSAKSGKKRNQTVIKCSIPTFRPDITEEIDLIEEVARVYGYHKIPEKTSSQLQFQSKPPATEFADQLRDWLIGSGYREVVTNSMQDKITAERMGRTFVPIANPISKDMAAMRTSMLPGILTVIRHNIFHGSKDLRLFEIGKTYFKNEQGTNKSRLESYTEQDRLIVAWSGMADRESWDRKPRKFDIFDAKGEIQSLAEKISLDNINFIPYPTTDPLTQAGLRIEIHGNYAGLIGLVHKKILSTFEIEDDICFAELHLPEIEQTRTKKKKFIHLPKFPIVERDIALIVDPGVQHETIVREIQSAGAKLLKSVLLFDSYSGDQIGDNKKSLAYRLQFMSDDHTLTQEEIERSLQLIIRHVTRVLNATIRQ